MRADAVRCYQPPDEFACRQAEEMADLQFELRRLERAKEVMLARERELLAREQRKRALRLKLSGQSSGGGESTGGPTGGSEPAAASADIAEAAEVEASGQNEANPDGRETERETSPTAGTPGTTLAAGSQIDACHFEKSGRNQGTKPLSPVLSVEASGQCGRGF
jgi:hypothetical protein